MCSNCTDYGFLIPHTESKCPVKAALHCSHCAIYGHTLETCSDRPAPMYSELMYVEQLIPLEQLAAFGITSRTPLPTAAAAALTPYPSTSTSGRLELVNEPKILREFLVSKGIKPSSKELVSQTNEYAKKMGLRLVLISRPPLDAKAKVEAYCAHATHTPSQAAAAGAAEAADST